MKRILTLLFVAVIGAMPSTAGAAILWDLVDYGNAATDKLQDESGSVVIDNNSNNTFDIGDVLQGVFAIPSVNNQNVGVATGGTLIGVFALEVTGISTVGMDTVLDFGQVSAANAGQELGAILSNAGISTAGLNSLSPTLGLADASLGVLSLTTAGTLFPAGINGTPNDLGLTNSYSVEVLGGLGGDDFYQVALFGANGATGPTSLPGEDEPTSFAGFRTAFSAIAGSNPFPVNFEELSNAQFDGTPAQGDFIGSGTISAPVNDLTPAGFGFGDDGTFTFQVVPEVTSLVVWGGLVSLMGVARTRRRRNSHE